jgi:hypothetical protein
VAAIIAVVAALIGAAAARFEPRLPGLGSSSPRSNRAVGVAMAAMAAVAVVAFIAAVGNPADWISKRADEFRNAGTPDLSANSTRFGFNVGSGRYDIWRTALSDAGEDLLLGDGGGGFQYSYLQKRRHNRPGGVHDAHSVELETLSEFGIPGLALLLTALGAVGVGIVQVRRRTPAAAGLAAIGLACGTYWLVHTSIDWFWPYPVVTAPLLGVLGAACAHGPPLAERIRLPWRPLLAVAAGVLAITMVPPFLSQRYVDQAYSVWRTDPAAAFDDLDRAQDLNRLSVTPLLAEGAIATASGDKQHAIAAFEEAAAKRPEEWAAHFLLARLQLHNDPAEARRELQTALELNPLETRVRDLAKTLGVTPES